MSHGFQDRRADRYKWTDGADAVQRAGFASGGPRCSSCRTISTALIAGCEPGRSFMGARTSVYLMLGLLMAMAPAKADPIKTSGGLVSGVAVSDSAARAYKGIPFAKPPVGDLRW